MLWLVLSVLEILTSSERTTSDTPTRLGALSSRDFRYYWFGYVISVSGQQMLWVAQAWLIYELSGSKLLLGVNGLAQALPAVTLGLFGGAIADKVNMRRLLIVSQVLRMAIMGALAAVAILEVIEVWHIMAVAFLGSAVGSFEDPARQAMFPHLIQRRHLTNAVALNSTIHPGTRIIGPAIAGVILAQVVDSTSSAMIAAGVAFSLTAVGFGMYALLLRMVHLPEVRRSTGKVFDEMASGIRFIWRNGVFGVHIGMMYFGMFFALSLAVLFPVFAKDILEVGPSGLGLLYTSMGAGSFIGAVAATRLTSALGRKRVMVGGFGAMGVFALLFALSGSFPIALVFLGLMGMGSSLFSVAAQSTIQQQLPDEYRGRVMGIWGLTHSAVRPFGEMQLSAVATVASAPFALAVGGGLVAVFAVVVAVPRRLLRGVSSTEVRR